MVLGIEPWALHIVAKYSTSSVPQAFNFRQGLAQCPRIVSNWSSSCLSLPGARMTGLHCQGQAAVLISASRRTHLAHGPLRSKAPGSFATKRPVKLEAMLGSPVCIVGWECSSVQRACRERGRGEGREGMWRGCSSQNKADCAAVTSKS